MRKAEGRGARVTGRARATPTSTARAALTAALARSLPLAILSASLLALARLVH